jgi:hypothetical protein
MVKTDLSPARGTADARAVAWVLVSFALLAAGVVAAAAASKGLRWILPSAGFVGYLFAMRHGLRLWNRDALDLVWRSTPAARPRHAGRSTSSRLFPFRDAAAGGRPARPRGPSAKPEGRPVTGPERV